MEDKLAQDRYGKKTVALVGMAQSTRHLAPWDDENIEIWTLNESAGRRFQYIKRVSRHFQLHPKWNYDRDTNQNDPEHPDWLRSVRDFPIYMQEVDSDIPASVKYPLDEVFSHFNIESVDHWKEFTSTFPYMLALAMYEGFDRIEVYGFEMGSETEYAFQRSSAHLWLGIARGMYLATGKPEIYIPEGSRLLGWASEMYAYDMILNLNPMELEINRNKFELEEKKLLGKIAEMQGIQDEIIKQLKDLSDQYNLEIQSIINKPGDNKLKDRRIKQKLLELQTKEGPLKTKLRDYDFDKLNLSQQLNYIKGMKDHAILLLAQHNAQITKITGVDRGVRIRT